MIISSRLKGFSEWELALTELMARNTLIMKAMLRAAAYELVQIIKERVPVGPPPEHMRDHVRWTSTDESSAISMSGLALLGNQASMFVTIDSYYARFVEFGTSRMPARPFFRPALDEAMDIIAAKLRKQAWDEIKYVLSLIVDGPKTLIHIVVEDIVIPLTNLPSYVADIAFKLDWLTS